MGERGPKKGVANRQGIQRMVRNIVETARLHGYEVDENASPAEIVLDELIRTNAAVQLMERRVATDWDTPELAELTDIVVTENGASTVTTEHAAWLDVLGKERDRLVKVAKMAHDMGIDEKRIQLAERQAEMMYTVINGLVDAMNLSNEQRAMIPNLLPTLIRQAAIPKTLEQKGWSEDWSTPGG